MAKRRFIGKGATVLVETNTNTFNTVGLITNIQPPPQEKGVIDVTAMEDTAVQAEQGIEQLSAFTFTERPDPDDTIHDFVDGLYSSGNTAGWQIKCNAGTAVWTMQFDGIVTGISRNAFGGNDGVTRTVTVQRTGAITDTVA